MCRKKKKKEKKKKKCSDVAARDTRSPPEGEAGFGR